MNVGGAVIDGTALVTVVAFLVSLLKPYVEELPFARVGSPMHDSTIQVLNVLLNVGLVLSVAAAAGALTAQSALPLAMQALAQAAGAHVLYTVLTRNGSSINDKGASAPAPAVVAAAAAGEQPSNL